MSRWPRSALVLFAAVAAVAGVTVPAAATPGTPVVLQSGVVTRQDIPTQSGSEDDTVVEPDVQVNPTDSDNAIAAAHDSRFADGGAVDISVAWTHDGGATWQHQAVPGITKAAGGPWDRASDPVVAFAADGTAYLSVLAISLDCPSAVVVLISHDGGGTWSKPHYAHRSTKCEYSDDKNWITVDTNPDSPYLGRVYQFWTPFRYTSAGAYRGSPQAVRWSDDEGRTWSSTSYVNGLNHGSQDSPPVILADGTVVDTYIDFGAGGEAPDAVPGVESPNVTARSGATAAPSAIDASGTLYASVSHNGGRTWSDQSEIVNNAYGYSPGVRCCLPSATIDPVTQRMYVTYVGGVDNTDPVYVASSLDGRVWNSPERVSQGDVNGVTRVNADVSALDGNVYVSYGTRTEPREHGGYVQQQLSVSTDNGRTFGPPQSIGPVSVLRYAAQARGYFPGDYIGTAVTTDKLYVVFARSSQPPPSSTSQYHQVIWGVTLRP